ncbi:LysE family transporter [Halanaeroarchaeum sulfurireducens]|uniref:Lysine transporter LysE n=1 Tax=Halanaeroarchaeum sulfurireducens TaxID=1604004 RepID=A0A0F7P813_9EURY|nr:LysE family transporter [Halanaeroarchaeum sulfurireducens]AKH97286.1 lysine transporter LysE [Halanaeroarchaeum sulfurireducens]ALG81688.1 lysine transporter LysE [Halanaeroarchaeum sulfurireducens]
MLTALLSIVAGLLLGLSLAAPPGPMNAVIAEESVNRSWRAGFAAGLGAMSADALFFVFALAGLVTVVENAPTLRGVMVGIGGLLMLYFAYGAVANAGSFSESEHGDAAGFGKAFALALTNPYQITWWLTAGIGLLNPGQIEAFGVSLSAANGLLTIGGFFLGILLWVTSFPAALRAAGDRVDALGTGIAYVSALVLVWFAGVFVLDAAGTLGLV